MTVLFPFVTVSSSTKGNNSDSSGESDTKKSGDVSNVLKETVTKENNSERSVTEHEKKSEGVRNDSQKQLKIFLMVTIQLSRIKRTSLGFLAIVRTETRAELSVTSRKYLGGMEVLVTIHLQMK